MASSAADIVRGRFNAEEFTEVTSDKCPGEVKNNPADSASTVRRIRDKMPKFSPRMKEVGFDAWAWSIANSARLLPSAVRNHIKNNPGSEVKMQKNFNKIWDGQSYKYAIHPKSGKMCGVVDEEDIARIVAADRTQTSAQENRLTDDDRMDKIEGDLMALLRKMGGRVNSTVQDHHSRDKMRKLRARTQDRQEARDILAMREARYNVRPTSGHGCAPFEAFKSTEAGRFRHKETGAPTKSTLHGFHVGAEELSSGNSHYFGRLPVRFGSTRDKVGCVPGDDPMWLAKNGDDRHGNAKIFHGLTGLQRVRKMPTYDQSDTAKFTIATSRGGSANTMSHGEAYQIAALCGQQLTQRECESAEPMVVTPLGNTKKNELNPKLVCQYGEHDRKPSQNVCQPKFLNKMTEGRDGMRKWYFGDGGANGDGFVDREQRTAEAYRRETMGRDYTPNDEIAVTPADRERARLAKKLQTNRYGRQHEKLFQQQMY